MSKYRWRESSGGGGFQFRDEYIVYAWIVREFLTDERKVYTWTDGDWVYRCTVSDLEAAKLAAEFLVGGT